MSENVRASTSRNPKGLYGLYRDKFTLAAYRNHNAYEICAKGNIRTSLLAYLTTFYGIHAIK
jgi:hypothetical protein